VASPTSVQSRHLSSLSGRLVLLIVGGSDQAKRHAADARQTSGAQGTSSSKAVGASRLVPLSVLETNTPMNRAMEGMGGEIKRRYRVYERAL
jgi:hypothetical protein